jgi:uncharacterized membrane protein
VSKGLSILKARQQTIAWMLLAIVMIVYALEMSRQAVLRYEVFQATAFDLGNLDQVLWNTIHGRLFQFTNQAIDWYGPPTRLAVHFEPIILPLSLLYAFHADPRILLVFQTLVLASGALPVFLLTRYFLPEWPLLGALMAVAYLLSPALLGVNIFDFHPVALATPLLLYAVLALTYRRYGWFILACVLAAACKEDVPMNVAMLGILVIWRYKQPRLGTLLIIGGFLWSAIAFLVIIPHFYPGAQHNNFWYRYEQLGSSPGAAIINIIVHPWLLFTTFITLDRLFYLAGLVRSSGFLPLLAPEWLIPALPTLAVNLLSTDPNSYSGVYQYNATIIPFIMIAAIHGTRRVILIWQKWRGENSRPIPPLQVPVNSAGANGTLFTFYLRIEAACKNRLLRALHVFAQSRPGSLLKASLTQITQNIRDNGRWQAAHQRGLHIGRAGLRQAQQHWRRFGERMTPLAKRTNVTRLQWIVFVWITFLIGLNFVIATPQINAFWPTHDPGPHEQQIEQLLAMIPPDASVSAGDNLNPHLTERQYVTVFPSVCVTSPTCTNPVQYIIVDLNNVFPDERNATASTLNQLVRSGQYTLLKQADGVWLLKLRKNPK